jgi:hypothetical protein
MAVSNIAAFNATIGAVVCSKSIQRLNHAFTNDYCYRPDQCHCWRAT